MKKLLVGLFLIAGSAALSNVYAQEKKLERKDLPPAVEQTVVRESVGATIKGFSTEIEKGKRLYEVELTVNGHGKDISMDAKGNIVEIEEQVSIDSLSAQIKAGLEKAAGSGKIIKIESLTKKDKIVAYEAVVANGTKHREIQVGPDGKKLFHEE